MKKSIFILSLSITPLLNIAQENGIYFSASDFVKHKISFEGNCIRPEQKIKADMIFHPDMVYVKRNDSLYKFHKDSIYAIKYCDGLTERIYKRENYPIINPGEKILIYKIERGGLGKVPKTITYYFSKSAKESIMELTISNLKSAFADNKSFLDQIDMFFKSDEDLVIYDTENKKMKINHVLDVSAKMACPK